MQEKQSKDIAHTFIVNILSVIATSCPNWNMSWEFGYFIDNRQEADVISIAIYDSDVFGSDDLVATQIIPLQYFKEKGEYGKILDFWLPLHSVDNFIERNEQIFVKSDSSLCYNANPSDFEGEIIYDPAVVNDESNCFSHHNLLYYHRNT